MAAADHRRALTGRWRATWLGVIGAGLALALLAAALVQGRQAALLSQTVQIGDDYPVLSVYEAESEFLRLRHQWHLAIDSTGPLDEAPLRLRYDVWVSRIVLLREGRTWRVLSAQAQFDSTLAQAQGFIARADRVLGDKP